MNELLSYNDALNSILDFSGLIPTESESVYFLESDGRVLAEDIYSDLDLPPFDNSAMDGYAININPNIKTWEIAVEISAGNFREIEINEHQTIIITTGSKIPASCNTVIPLEDVRIDGNHVILTNEKSFKSGANIRLKGRDFKKDTIAIPKYRILTNKHIPVLASFGCEYINVFKKFKTSLLSTGDELVDIGTRPDGDKIRASNIYSLLAQSRKNQLNPVFEGILSDDVKAIKNKFKDLLENDSPIIITTGGVSVGKYDLIKDIWEELGVRIVFWKSNIKPGKPILFGIFENRKFIFGLPGNPLSSFVGFEIFIKPLIIKIFNLKSGNFTAVLSNDILKKDTKRHFLLGKFEINQSIVSVSINFSQNSGNLFDMSLANCLVVFNENEQKKSIGEIVECIAI